MPVGLRGLLVAGIFATAMGSLSAALNALATTFTRDWYPSFTSQPKTERQTVRAAQFFTGIFAVLMIGVASATAFFVILYPTSRIIPIALGIFGYTYGSLLGVFLLGMLTKKRGSDRGNYLAMACGFIVVAIMSQLPNDFLQLLHQPLLVYPPWFPVISFPWRILFGTLVTFSIAFCFTTPRPTEAP
jgi:solute:Na+ symporter, SSS family